MAELLAPLFGTPEASAIFADRTRLQGMLDFEAALARAEARVGVIPPGAVTTPSGDAGSCELTTMGSNSAVHGRRLSCGGWHFSVRS